MVHKMAVLTVEIDNLGKIFNTQESSKFRRCHFTVVVTYSNVISISSWERYVVLRITSSFRNRGGSDGGPPSKKNLLVVLARTSTFVLHVKRSMIRNCIQPLFSSFTNGQRLNIQFIDGHRPTSCRTYSAGAFNR